MPAAWFGIFGLVMGSFGNVVAYRVPRKLSVAKPRSFCPSCEEPVAWYDNIPVFSWLVLRGRCRRCGAPISARYPMIEAGTAVLWAAITMRIGLQPELPMFLIMGWVLVVLSAVDLEHRKLPNRILGPAAIVAVMLGLAAAAMDRSAEDLTKAAIGAVAYGLPFLVLVMLVPAGMGGGDLKLAGYLGWHLGWLTLGHVVVGAFMGFFIGAGVGMGLMAAGRKGRKDAIPFGPSMAAGGLVALFAGNHLLRLWLGVP